MFSIGLTTFFNTMEVISIACIHSKVLHVKVKSMGDLLSVGEGCTPHSSILSGFSTYGKLTDKGY